MDEIKSFILNSKDPVTSEDIINSFQTKLTDSKIKLSLVELIKLKEIESFTSNNTVFFKGVIEQYKNEMKMIYTLLHENKNGLTARQIRIKLQLSVNLVSKILHKMEMSDQIKSYKGVRGNVKIYSLFENENKDSSVFFNDGEVDTEFVENMIKIIQKLFNKTEVSIAGLLSVDEVHAFIKNCNVFDAVIEKKDIAKILKIMFYDNLIIEIKTGKELLYLLK